MRSPTGQAPLATIVVIAKAPLAGRVKTRLCPPLTPHAAAAVAGAALADTLDVVRDSAASRRMLALAGVLADRPAGFDVVPQRGDGFGERLAAAFADAGPGPVLLIGMDTPQVCGAVLDDALRLLSPVDAANAANAVDAVLGRAIDGGWWALGLRDPRAAEVLSSVEMSTAETAVRTHAALIGLGLEVGELPMLRDVDTMSDARSVAAAAPATRFARVLAIALREPAIALPQSAAMA